jgi:hypothetical protein
LVMSWVVNVQSRTQTFQSQTFSHVKSSVYLLIFGSEWKFFFFFFFNITRIAQETNFLLITLTTLQRLLVHLANEISESNFSTKLDRYLILVWTIIVAL